MLNLPFLHSSNQNLKKFHKDKQINALVHKIKNIQTYHINNIDSMLNSMSYIHRYQIQIC